MGGLLGKSPSLNTSGGDTYRSILSKIGGSYGDMFNQANGQYQQSNANDQRAQNALSQYLMTDPATDTYNAQQVAGAERGASEGAVSAQANLDQTLAARGIAPDSSMGVGGAASIQAQLAGNHANILAQQAQANENRRASNLAENANLWSGAAGTDFGRATGALGSQAGIASGQLSEQDQLDMDEYNQKVAQQNANTAFWGQLASAGVGAWGGPAHAAAAGA